MTMVMFLRSRHTASSCSGRSRLHTALHDGKYGSGAVLVTDVVAQELKSMLLINIIGSVTFNLSI